MARLTLQKALNKKKLSKYRFAKLMGIDYKNTPRMFKPTYDPHFSQLSRIAKAIGCRVRDLFEE